MITTSSLNGSLHPECIETFLESSGRHSLARFSDICLRSHYQPIYSLVHQRAVGFEALVRPSDINGELMAPGDLFAMAQNLEDTVFLDRLCRTLHVRNFVNQADDISWLFLNVDPLVTTHGRQFGAFFKQLLERHQIPPHRVVIEILEGKIEDETLLAESIRYYRDMGCLVAIDDFGVGQSNFDRIWRIAPHIVKLDRSIIEQAVSNSTARRVLPSLVSVIHEAGSLVLVEGVETEAQALLAIQAEIDFVQGYYFCRPQEILPALHHPGIGKLFDRFRQSNQLEEIATNRNFNHYVDNFFNAAVSILEGAAISVALDPFLQLAHVKRCYLLDDQGMQVGSNYSTQLQHTGTDARFNPLNDARNAIWIRRRYFQNAIDEPGRVHISKPYLSITGGNLCVTLSIATYHGDKLGVLCGDIDWKD